MKDIHELARKRVAAKKGFYQHFTIYLIVSSILLLINLIPFFTEWFVHNPDAPLDEVIRELLFFYPYWWCQYPIMGWGISIAIHGFMVFGVPSIGKFDGKWEERAIQKEIKHLQENKTWQEEGLKETPLKLKELQKELKTRNHWDNSELV